MGDAPDLTIQPDAGAIVREKGRKIRVGFISTRISGTDGVSLEIGKWANVIPDLGKGFECFYICGESDRPADRTFLIEEARFRHTRILDITRQAFSSESRTPQLTTAILDMSAVLMRKLDEAIRTLDLALSSPKTRSRSQ